MTYMREELKPIYDYHKSFYNKAYVEAYGTFMVLKSYGTIVAVINSNGTAELTEHWNYSRTTARHLAEFLRQHGFDSSEVGLPALRKALKSGTFTRTTEHDVKNRIFAANIDAVRELTATA